MSSKNMNCFKKLSSIALLISVVVSTPSLVEAKDISSSNEQSALTKINLVGEERGKVLIAEGQNRNVKPINFSRPTTPEEWYHQHRRYQNRMQQRAAQRERNAFKNRTRVKLDSGRRR